MSLFQTTEPPFRFRQGTRPLLISMPHVGTHVPLALASRFTAEARHVPDTDWHIERLYDFADELGASVLVATHSRYVIDVNRPPDDQNLYPGQDTTGLCPVDTFDKTPIYAASDLPGVNTDRETRGSFRPETTSPHQGRRTRFPARRPSTRRLP